MVNPLLKIREFLTEVTVELKKSSWPTRRELVDSTVVVIITLLILGAFVAGADFLFAQIVARLMRS